MCLAGLLGSRHGWQGRCGWPWRGRVMWCLQPSCASSTPPTIMCILPPSLPPTITCSCYATTLHLHLGMTFTWLWGSPTSQHQQSYRTKTLVFSLKLNFKIKNVGISSACCFPCDRSKTKLTPSHQTWTGV